MERYFKAVRIVNGETVEPVQYVGVYTLRWHAHPEAPELGFAPADDVVDSLVTALKGFMSSCTRHSDTTMSCPVVTCHCPACEQGRAALKAAGETP